MTAERALHPVCFVSGLWPVRECCVSRRLGSIVCDGIAFNRPGSDLLSRVLRRSTIGAGAFHGRVRNGNGCGRPAMTTRSIKGNEPTFLLACVEKLDFGSSPDLVLAG